MSEPNTRTKGKIAEDLATVFLIKKQWRILGRNLNYRFGEIDILAVDLDARQLVIVEVKAKSGVGFGAASEMLPEYKQRRLRKLAKWILAQYNKPVRIDVVTVEQYLSPEPHIEHYVHAIGE